MSFKWQTINSLHAQVLAAYTETLVEVVTGSKGVLSLVYRALTMQLKCKYTAVGDVDWVTTREIVAAVHSCVKRLLNIVPSSGVALFQAVEQSYPYKGVASCEQILYCEATLQMATYCESIESQLFDLVLTKLLILDTEINPPDQTASNALDEQEDDLVFNWEGESDSSGELKEELRMRATTMDKLMELCFNYVDTRRLDVIPESMCDGSVTSLADFPPQCNSQCNFFSTLLSAFHVRLLPTLRCKFVQFIVFYACTKKPEVYPRLFVSSLMALHLQENMDSMRRSLAVLYLGSFVARFDVLPLDVVQQVLESLLGWAVAKASSVKPEFGMPDNERHHQFYMVCNSVFYMLCFRAADVARFSEDACAAIRQSTGLLLECSLNPLLFTPKEIRKEMQQCVSMFDASKIEACIKANKRILLTPRTQPVPSAFPFDPYLLSEGEKRLSPWYKQWEDDESNSGAGTLYSSAGKGFDAGQDGDDDGDDGFLLDDGDATSSMFTRRSNNVEVPDANRNNHIDDNDDNDDNFAPGSDQRPMSMSLGTPVGVDSFLLPLMHEKAASASGSPTFLT